MNQVTVRAGELDYRDEYDPTHEVYYGAVPFTGIAREGRETTTYLNGRAHGRYLLYADTGALSAEGEYADGECMYMQSWYADGTLRQTYQRAGEETNHWDQTGKLRYRATGTAEQHQFTWFYATGTPKQHTTKRGTDYFAVDGQLAMRVTYGQPLNSVRYNDAVLQTNYLDVLTHYPAGPEASADKTNAEWYFFGWVWLLLKTDKPAAIAILHHLRHEGFSTAGQILKRLPAIDLATFTPAFSYRIEN